MAIKLNTSYSKKLGLPGYSSHAFSASVEVELSDLSDVGTECARLYGLLQGAVDGEIRNPGFVPEASSNSDDQRQRRGRRRALPDNESRPCSDRQRSLIDRVAHENKLPPDELESLALQHGGAALDALDKAGASRLIDALFERFGSKRQAA